MALVVEPLSDDDRCALPRFTTGAGEAPSGQGARSLLLPRLPSESSNPSLELEDEEDGGPPAAAAPPLPPPPPRRGGDTGDCALGHATLLWRVRRLAARPLAALPGWPHCGARASASKGERLYGTESRPLPAGQAGQPPAWPQGFRFDFEAEQWAFEGLEMLDYRCLLELALRGWGQDRASTAPRHAAATPGTAPPQEMPLLFSQGEKVKAMLGLGWCDRRRERRGGRGGPGEKSAPGVTPLHIACQQRHWDVARWLLSLGADPDVADSSGETPLAAVARCCRDLAKAAAAAKRSKDEASVVVTEQDSERAQQALRELLARSRAKDRVPEGLTAKDVVEEVRLMGHLCRLGCTEPRSEQGAQILGVAGLPTEVLERVLVPMLPAPLLDEEACVQVSALALEVALACRPAFADVSFPRTLHQA